MSNWDIGVFPITWHRASLEIACSRSEGLVRLLGRVDEMRRTASVDQEPGGVLPMCSPLVSFAAARDLLILAASSDRQYSPFFLILM
jgi:hypothetical protein